MRESFVWPLQAFSIIPHHIGNVQFVCMREYFLFSIINGDK